MSTQVSEHFKLEEFFSKNDKGKTFKADMPTKELLLTLEELRLALNRPIVINSGIRSVEHNNSLAGSSKNSAHLRGMAADIHVDGISAKQIAGVIKPMYDSGNLEHLAEV